MRQRKPDVRKDEILKAAAEVAQTVGFNHIQREDVAREAGCATGTVNIYFGTMKQLKRAVMRYAIENDIDTIIMQGIACNAPEVKKLPEARRREILCTALSNS